MNRPRKRKESSLLDELKELELVGEREFVDIPELENEDLIEENSMSIIVRCLNPTVHKVGGLVKALPLIWGLEDIVKGRGVGENKVQFFLQHERDIQYMLTKGPWFVNGWIVSLDQWSPNPGPEFLCRIPFWIRIRGIPVHLLKKQAIEGMMGPLGRVENVELHAKNSSSVEYVRALLYCDMQEDLAVDYWESRARSRQNIRLEARSSVSRQGKDDNELRNAAKGGHRGTITSKSELVPRRSTNLSNRRGLERKGNNVVGETSQIWKPKSSQSVPLKGVGRSRSTEESPHPGNKSTSQGMMGAGASSGVSQESPSVFSRLGDQKDISPQERQLSGSQRKEDRPSSLVFERLGGHNSSSSIERQIEDTKSSGNKRRRLSRSDERIPKKARLGREREETPS
ncbi:hypothetical protein HID58_080154, partial [Brassica napus]